MTGLQDTHLTHSELHNIRTIWKGDIYLSGIRTNVARGVAILMSNNFKYKVGTFEHDKEGNMIILDLIISDIKIQLINIYGPNTDNPQFFSNIKHFLCDHEQDYIIWCGDFNISINPTLDCYNYATINNPRSRKTLLEVIDEFNLIDVYRHFYPNRTRYTWR